MKLGSTKQFFNQKFVPKENLNNQHSKKVIESSSCDIIEHVPSRELFTGRTCVFKNKRNASVNLIISLRPNGL